MTRDELFQRCVELHERQCRAHGIDPSDTMQQGVFRNLMQFVLDEWSEREENSSAPISRASARR